MCVVSMTGDFFDQRWRRDFPWIYPSPSPTDDKTTPVNPFPITNAPSQKEFEDLKREVQLLKELLQKSKEYDEKNNEPDCEIEAKMQKLREIAKIVGIDLDEVLKKK